MCDHRVRHVEDAVIVETLEPRLLLSAALAAARAAAPAPLMEECPLAVLVPAVVEQESEGGGTNNVAADAQVLQFQSIFGDNGPGPLQAVIKGTADGMGGGGAVYNGSSMVFGAVAAPNVYDLGMTDTFAPGGDGVVTITAKADLDGADEYLTLAAEGVVLGDVFVNDGLSFAAVTAQVTIPAALLAALAADGIVELTVAPSAAVEREQSGYVMAELAYAGLGGGGTADCYAIDLQAGELLSLAADGAVSLELVDAEGTVLAEGDIAG
ncbi:MAG: LEPR-XLL domain-containing protein, partial [Planctomycetes bacterium]|nr:LEPR-XLL domain-containing protein [Planctomycetota bacterium]